jgi:hypothetical protein
MIWMLLVIISWVFTHWAAWRLAMWATQYERSVPSDEAAFTLCIGMIPFIGFAVCIMTAFIRWPWEYEPPCTFFERNNNKR